MTDSGPGDGGGDSSGSGGSDAGSDSSGGGLGGDAGVGNDGGSLGGNESGPGADGPGPDPGGWGGPDTVGQNPSSSLAGYSPSADGASFYSTGPVSLQPQTVSPSVLSGVRSLTQGTVNRDSAVLSLTMGLMTAAMPGFGLLAALTDIAVAMGLDRTPGPELQSGPGGAPGGGDAAASFRGPDSSGPSVTVNSPVFLPVGGSGLPGAAATFLGPQNAMADSAAAGPAPVAAGDEAPLWPAVAAAALIALVAA